MPSASAIPSNAAPTLGCRFALVYAAIAAALFGVYAFPFELFGVQGDWLTGYLAAYASLAGSLLSVLEPSVVVDGTYIHGRFALQIVRNCDAADVSILFGSAVLAYPGPWARKPLPLLLGLLGILVVNVLRICSLYYVGVYEPSWFRAAHEEVWPILLVVGTLAAFVGCLPHLSAPRAAQPAAG